MRTQRMTSCCFPWVWPGVAVENIGTHSKRTYSIFKKGVYQIMGWFRSLAKHGYVTHYIFISCGKDWFQRKLLIELGQVCHPSCNNQGSMENGKLRPYFRWVARFELWKEGHMTSRKVWRSLNQIPKDNLISFLSQCFPPIFHTFHYFSAKQRI